MPVRPCLEPRCGHVYDTQRERCPKPRCPRSMRRPSRGQQARIPRSAAERKRRAQAVADWIAAHGYVCPGFNRPPHPSRDLTADHVLPQSLGGVDGPLRVLCRRCNTARGGSNRLGRPK